MCPRVRAGASPHELPPRAPSSDVNAVALPSQLSLVSALVQDHAVGMDACLVGPKGCGKTTVAERFAAALGYEPLTMHCYRDMSARDLLQRRETDARGDTIWRHSPAVQAAPAQAETA